MFASFVVLVEQLSHSFLNAGRAVFAEEFEHEAVKRLHAKLKRLVANPQHRALDALQVVHYGNPTKPSHRMPITGVELGFLSGLGVSFSLLLVCAAAVGPKQ